MQVKLNDLYKKAIEINNRRNRISAWREGVNYYISEILDNYEGCKKTNFISTDEDLEDALLIGASDWNKYSYGGFSLIYNEDIAKTLCTKSELKRFDNGLKDPSGGFLWMDIQTRALKQAYLYIKRALCEMA